MSILLLAALLAIGAISPPIMNAAVAPAPAEPAVDQGAVLFDGAQGARKTGLSLDAPGQVPAVVGKQAAGAQPLQKSASNSSPLSEPETDRDTALDAAAFAAKLTEPTDTAELGDEPIKYAPVPGTEWEQVVGFKFNGVLDDRDPSIMERLPFTKEVKKGLWYGVKEKICSAIAMPIKPGIDPTGYLHTTPSFIRKIEHLAPGEAPMAPKDTLALIDIAGLSIRLGHSEPISLASDNPNVTFLFSVGTEMKGASIVKRPLPGLSQCEAAKKVLPNHLDEFKVALPLKADRFSAMEIGETWKLPLKFSWWIRPQAGYGLPPGFGVRGWFESSQEGAETVSLHRVSQKQLNFRLRLDQIRAQTVGGEAAYRFALTNFIDHRVDITNWDDDPIGRKTQLWVRDLDKIAIEFINRFLTLRVGIIARWSDEKRMVMDFELDPENPEEMKALENFLSGRDWIAALDDLIHNKKSPGDVASALIKFGEGAAKAIIGQNLTKEDVQRKGDEVSKQLGKPPVALGLNHAKENPGVRIPVHVPVLGKVDWTVGKHRCENIDLLHDGTNFRICREIAAADIGFLDMFIGYRAENKWRDATIAFTHKDKDGKEYPPVAMLVQQQGLTTHSRQIVESTLEKANGVLQYIGVRGSEYNQKTRIPYAAVFPPGSDPNAGAQLMPRAIYALTILLNEQALDDLQKSSPRDIIKAYAHALDFSPQEREMMQWIASHGRIYPDGFIDYSESDLTRAFQSLPNEEIGRARQLVGWASGLVKDIQRLKPKQGEKPLTYEERLKQLDKMLSGYDSALKREYFFKVAVQLVNPRDVYSKFTIYAESGGKDPFIVEKEFVLKKELRNSHIREMGKASRRFLEDQP